MPHFEVITNQEYKQALWGMSKIVGPKAIRSAWSMAKSNLITELWTYEPFSVGLVGPTLHKDKFDGP